MTDEQIEEIELGSESNETEQPNPLKLRIKNLSDKNKLTEKEKEEEDNGTFDLSNETFSRKQKVHDWRNHVLGEVQEIWATLTIKEKWLVAMTAEKTASNENWDSNRRYSCLHTFLFLRSLVWHLCHPAHSQLGGQGCAS